MSISKRLLSEVLFSRQKIDYIIKKVSPNCVYYQEDNLNGETVINIHELAYKCKEWAYNDNNYILSSWKDRDCYYCEIDNDIAIFSSDTNEPEAIFQACQWIYNNPQSL